MHAGQQNKTSFFPVWVEEDRTCAVLKLFGLAPSDLQFSFEKSSKH